MRLESEDSGGNWGVIESEIVPYQDEPLAEVSKETGDGDFQRSFFS